MTEHTPGPWVAHKYGIRDVGGYICALKWPSLYTGQDERYWKETAERQADARLIAAAPDLLEALKAVLSADLYADAEGLVSFAYPNTVEGEAAAEIARAAIKKATQP